MNASIRPSTNTGVEKPMLANSIVPTSAAELRLYAETMPSGTPTPMANTSEKKVSSMVVGRRWR